jgi:hypothetical protein
MPPVPGDRPDPFDPTVPSATRVYDFLSGGSQNFAADREIGRQIEAAYPLIREIARSNREFTGRAVTWCARTLGIRQYLDLGAGLPAAGSACETALAVIPDARYAAIDNDADVVSHAQTLLSGRPGVVIAEADLRDVRAVLAHPSVRRIINPERPVAVIAALVLQFTSAADASKAISGYMRRMVPGSAVILSCGRCDSPELGERLVSKARHLWPEIPGKPLRNHSREEMLGFLRGLELVTPGLVPARAWRGGMPDPGLKPLGPGYVLSAVAVKR